MNRSDSALIVAAIARTVRASTRGAWLVIAGFVILAALAAGYVSRHIAITTDSSKLLSSSLPWRQQEIKLDAEFPQRTDRIIAVVDAATPESAEEAAAALANALQPRSDLIRTVSRPDGGAFFARNGVLFLSLDEVRRDTAQLIKAEPFLGTLAADPTLRGVMGAISQSTEGLRLGKTTLDDMKPAMAAISDALDAIAAGQASGLLLAQAHHRPRTGGLANFVASSTSSLCSTTTIFSRAGKRRRRSAKRSPSWA